MADGSDALLESRRGIRAEDRDSAVSSEMQRVGDGPDRRPPGQDANLEGSDP